MSNLIIRRATREDLPAILELVRELAVFEKEPEAVTADLKIYQEVFDEKLITCDVAVVDNEIVGMTIFCDAFSTWKGRMMYLEDFYVKPGYRNLKIGSKLFDALIEECKRRACVLLKWQVLDWNEDAIRFYKSKNAEIETTWYNGKLWMDQV